jgi:fructose-1-phosphate kinase PfkB-like protein
VAAVGDHGARYFVELWHPGRQSEYTGPGAAFYEAPSAVATSSMVTVLAMGRTLAEAAGISGTAVAGEPEEVYRDFVEAAHRQMVPVLLDSYRTHGRHALDAAPEVLKINADELAELSARPCGNTRERAAAARGIIERFGVRWVIVTRGREGAEGFGARGGAAAEAPRVRLVNAIGSGDSFTAGVVAHLLAARLRAGDAAGVGDRALFPPTASLQDALRLGVAMGSANCMNLKPGHIEEADFRLLYDAISVTSEGRSEQ